jgi:hypothetical protein
VKKYQIELAPGEKPPQLVLSVAMQIDQLPVLVQKN